MDDRLVKSIEGVLYRRGSSKQSTVAVEISRMHELRAAFEACRPEKKLTVGQKWVANNGKSREILEVSDHRVGYSYTGNDGTKKITTNSIEQWKTWVNNTCANCFELGDYTR
tara:strand:+ start:463 stop:798 length:336 start_codon:yes stop_codon:yes gene_type:complete